MVRVHQNRLRGPDKTLGQRMWAAAADVHPRDEGRSQVLCPTLPLAVLV